MKNYLLVDARGAFEAASARLFYDLARGLAKRGARVELLLVQNGVMRARAGAAQDEIAAAMKDGVAVLADEFSLRERALSHDRLLKGVKSAPLATVVDRMCDGWNVMWH
jgi:predicted peroxiredoxin